MKKVKYGRLHVHSEYSLHDAACSPEEIVKKAKDMGCDNITLTDHGTLLGILHFMKAGEKYGVNTIPGIEFYLENREHFLVVAKNHKGYVSLSHALKSANKFLHKRQNKTTIPCLQPADLEQHFRGNANVFATTACIGGAVGQILLRNRKVEKMRNKILGRSQKYRDGWETCRKHDAMFHAIEREIKSIDTEMKLIKPYTQVAYGKKIAKIEDEFERSAMIAIREDAIERTTIMVDERKSLMSRKKEVRSIATKSRAKYASYEKALAGVANLVETSDADLYEEAKAKILYYKSIFPEFYVEIQYCGIEDEAYVLPIIVQIARETNTPLILGSDAHMIDNSNASILARQIVRFNYFKKHEKVDPYFKELYLKNDEEVKAWFKGIVPEDAVLEALENLKVLALCKVIAPKEPHYPKAHDHDQFLPQLEKRKKQMQDRGIWNNEYESRLKHEVDIISSMGFIDYHMIVQDFCNAARVMGMVPKSEVPYMPTTYDKLVAWIEKRGYTEGVGVGPGRGSAAGSLVCYMLGITNIDPIKYGLLFERFLNPERVSMPDIDSDIKTSIRPHLLNYLKEKYGEDSTCAIDTEMTYAAKNAIKLAARDLGSMYVQGTADKSLHNDIKYRYQNAGGDAVKFIDDSGAGIGASLSELKDEFFLKFQKSTIHKSIWRNAMLIEGRISGTGIHAGAIIISDNDNVSDYIPVHYSEEKETWAAQCNMVQAEEDAGLLKMDVLGLGTLDCISDCISLVKKRRGISLNPDDFSFDDDVFAEVFSKGRTNSVFQFESGGMKDMLRKFKPTSIQDIILLVAAYRPGPMQFLPDIIAVKHGKKPLTYLIPALEPFLSMTYGAIIYQEQVMQIFQSLAGYSLGQADMVRRAMSKKKMQVLEMEREAFINGDAARGIYGTSSQGIDPEKASELFDQILEFSKYAFNKSHAACYAIIAYWTAYLKHYYTTEYMCAMFQNKSLDKFGPLFEDLSIYGIKMLPPSIHHSYSDFVIEKDALRFGFSKIKGVADEGVFEMIAKERSGANKEAPFLGIADFLIRTSIYDEGAQRVKLLQKKIMEGLIYSGAFDDFDSNRQKIAAFYKEAVAIVQSKGDHAYLYEMIREINVDEVQKNESDSIMKEILVLDQLISVNPLHFVPNEQSFGCKSISELGDKDLDAVYIAGFPVDIKEGTTKKGMPMLSINFKTIGGVKKVFCFGWKVKGVLKSISLYKPTKLKGNWRAGTGEEDDGLFIVEDTGVLEPFKVISRVIDTEEKARALASILASRSKENEHHRLFLCASVNKAGERIAVPKSQCLYINEQALKRVLHVLPN